MIKKITKSLLILSLVANTAWLSGHTNKTYLATRSQNVNTAMEYTTWNASIYNLDLDSKEKNFNKTRFALTTFYQESTKRADIGKYFGICTNNKICFFNNTADGVSRTVDSRYLIHDSDRDLFDVGNLYTDYKAVVKLDPRQELYGLRLDFYQNLDVLFKNLYLKTNAPLVYVKNDMMFKVANASTDGEDVSSCDIGQLFSNYFSGKYTGSLVAENKQGRLKYAKMDSAQTAVGIADIDCALGYKVLNTDRYIVAIDFGVTIPTGNTVEGRYLFEPVYGNGGHFGFGAGIEFDGKIWKKGNKIFKITLSADYRYLIQATEQRTLGLRNCNVVPDTNNTCFDGCSCDDCCSTVCPDTCCCLPFGHYYLFGKEGDTQGTPAANLLTTNLNVEPGSQVDAIFAMQYYRSGFTFDIGYNFFWKDSEDVSINSSCAPFDLSEYGLIFREHDMSTALDKTSADWETAKGDNVTFENAYRLKNCNLDVNAARTPSYMTHKIFVGAGYIYEDWRQPIMLGIGGSYEFANSSHELENWQLWFKAGLTF